MEYRLKFHNKRNAGTYESFQVSIGDSKKVVGFSKKVKEVTIDSDKFEALKRNDRFMLLYENEVIECYSIDGNKQSKVEYSSPESSTPDTKVDVDDTEDEPEVSTTTTRRTARKTRTPV